MTAQADRRAAARPTPDVRHRGREVAIQMLYQWEVGGLSIDEIRQHVWSAPEESDLPVPEPTREFALRLVEGVLQDVVAIDALIGEAAEHWRLERMHVLDRLILRLATYELRRVPDAPAAVVINEALELAHTFSGDESVRFVNGVLDAIRRTLGRE